MMYEGREKAGIIAIRPEDMYVDDETIDIRNLIIVIKKRRWTIFTILSVCVLLAAVYSFTHPPVYRATARIFIEKETPNIVSFKEVVDSDMADHDYYQSQVQILKSRPLAQQVIQQLHLTVDTLQSSMLPILRWLTEAMSQVKIWMGKPEEISEIVNAAIEEERLIRLFLESIRVTPVKGSRIVAVSADAGISEQAASIANTLVDMYIRQHLEMKLVASKNAVSWLMKEVEDAKKKLTESEAALQKYKEDHEILSLQDRQNIVMQKLSELNSAVHQAKVRRMEIEAHYQRIQNTSKKNLATLPQVLEDPLVRQLKLRLVALENEMVELRKKFREKHPSVSALESQIEGIHLQIEDEIQGIIKSVQDKYEIAQAQEQDLLKALEQQKTEVQTLNQKTIKYSVLEREVESNRQIYNALLQRMKETSLTERLETSNIRIIEQAVVPIFPIAPKKTRNLLLAAGIGLFLGFGVAFFLENLDTKLRTPHDVKNHLKIPMLAAIPKVTAKQVVPYAENGTLETIIATMMILERKSNVAESYRSLRTNMSFARLGESSVFLVTSSIAGEGKSSVVSNLGIAIAQCGQKTLIIDCDFRKPIIHQFFGLQCANLGFSDLLVNAEADAIEKVIHPTDLKHLDFIPCGSIPPNPSELLGLEKTAWIIEMLAQAYHTILIDSPPVNVVTDPIILSQMVHGVIFVIKAGTTSDIVQHALDQLQQADVKVCGSVLNNIDLKKDGYYYYGYKDGQYYQAS